MNVRTFYLKALDGSESDIFAVGMSIITPAGDQHNVIFRPSVNDDKALLMQTRTPDRALKLLESIVPLRVEWLHDEEVDASHGISSGDAGFHVEVNPLR